MATVTTLFPTIDKYFYEKGITPGPLMDIFVTPPCGGGVVGSGQCPGGQCCSVNGHCGVGEEYCGKGHCIKGCKYETDEVLNQLKFPDATIETGTCGGGVVGNGLCQNGCCTKWGFCGFGIEYCNVLDCIGSCQDLKAGLYNGNHFWSNFEIADFRFFRGQQYTDYFDLLDRSGGFFYERWGDAPVHSIAVGAFLQPHEVHYFGGIFV